AFLKAMLSVGYRLPVRSILLSTGPLKNKVEFIKNARLLREAGIALFATRGTAEFLGEHGVEATLLHWPLEHDKPNVLDHLAAKKVDLVINVPKNYEEEELTNDYLIRRRAVDCNVPLITDFQVARRLTEAIVHKSLADLSITSWAEYLQARRHLAFP